eukprot:gene10595-12329_t
MKMEAQLIKLQKFTTPMARQNRDAKSELPKYFEIGTFANNHEDYYNRYTNKEKRRGNMGDILANEKVLEYIDRKSSKIIADDKKRDKILKRRAGPTFKKQKF